VKDEGLFTCAHDGDYLMTYFQCGKCHFRNVQGQDPEFGKRRDALFERCIRRGTIDAFWSKEESTMRGARGGIRVAIQKAGMINGINESLVQYSTAKNVTTALGALWEKCR
jgi:hypothetical protein